MSSTARSYKYYDFIMAAYAVVLVCSNLIGPGKLAYVNLFGFQLEYGVGNLFFPFSYIFGDVLTEVYGYARSRRVIWMGFAACAFAAVMCYFVVNVPYLPVDAYQKELQASLEYVFGNAARIVLASLAGVWAGEFTNSFVMAKMKIWTRGKALWTRTIGSTIVGQTVDSFVFYPLAFLGIWKTGDMLTAIILAILFKTVWEAILTPLTYYMVRKLKTIEQEDYYDLQTDFTPFSLQK
jgi:uncharacterized integral membrane protein (TIGR00697 family)